MPRLLLALLLLVFSPLTSMAETVGSKTVGSKTVGSETFGSVQLPLPDYLSLLEQAEAAERQARVETEKVRADLTTRTVLIDVREVEGPKASQSLVAEIVTTFQVELTGTPTVPVMLPVSGLAKEVTVEPRRGASLARETGHVVFFAPEPGSYKVIVRGHGAFEQKAGVGRLSLAASGAPVSSLEVELPMDREWSCNGAVLVSEEVTDQRRFVRLAPARGQEHVFEVRRDYGGEEREKALVRSSVVSVIEVEQGGSRQGGSLIRRDVVFYEVLRGELGIFDLTLPAGLDLDRVATDEGEAFPMVDQGRLKVEREHRLSGSGHLMVAYRPQRLSEQALPLKAPELSTPAQAHYLVAASVVAAEVRPQPENRWRRIDLEDLPDAFGQEIKALRPNAVWKLSGSTENNKPGEISLVALPLPEVRGVGGVVWERKTTTLLTVDGSLVHRDRLLVEGVGTALEVKLVAGTTLWSAMVDEVTVRSLERGTDPATGEKTMIVPLSFQTEGRTTVELVTVQEREFEHGRSRATVESLQVALPVVRHQWRVLLPENNRYRFVSSQLEPVKEVARRETGSSNVPSSRVELEKIPSAQTSWISAVGNESSSVTGIVGTVTEADTGSMLPGVSVILKDSETGQEMVQITNADGEFRFLGMDPKQYQMTASLDGFSSVEHSVTLNPRQSSHLMVNLSLIAALEETITVTAESPLLDSRIVSRQRLARENALSQEAVEDTLGDLQDGLVGGVKPLEVQIPESGKLLVLSGALPPTRVVVELDVKAR